MDFQPIDREEFLTREDIDFMMYGIKRFFRGWLSFGAIGGALLGIFQSSDETWFIALGLWLTIALLRFLGFRSKIINGKKRILRGIIAQRYASRGSEDSAYVFYVNGKRLQVPFAIFKEYYTRDFAEFHYLDDTILYHRLLKRGDKEYTNAGSQGPKIN